MDTKVEPWTGSEATKMELQMGGEMKTKLRVGNKVHIGGGKRAK